MPNTGISISCSLIHCQTPEGELVPTLQMEHGGVNSCGLSHVMQQFSDEFRVFLASSLAFGQMF